VIALNLDPEAPIFNSCNYGVVGDALKVVPILVEVIKTKYPGLRRLSG
jgi:electron transfer flavoprotein alpha subunit